MIVLNQNILIECLWSPWYRNHHHIPLVDRCAKHYHHVDSQDSKWILQQVACVQPFFLNNIQMDRKRVLCCWKCNICPMWQHMACMDWWALWDPCCFWLSARRIRGFIWTGLKIRWYWTMAKVFVWRNTRCYKSPTDILYFRSMWFIFLFSKGIFINHADMYRYILVIFWVEVRVCGNWVS